MPGLSERVDYYCDTWRILIEGAQSYAHVSPQIVSTDAKSAVDLLQPSVQSLKGSQTRPQMSLLARFINSNWGWLGRVFILFPDGLDEKWPNFQIDWEGVA